MLSKVCAHLIDDADVDHRDLTVQHFERGCPSVVSGARRARLKAKRRVYFYLFGLVSFFLGRLGGRPRVISGARRARLPAALLFYISLGLFYLGGEWGGGSADSDL